MAMIGGNVANSGNFQLLGSGSMATIGSLTNSAGGSVDLENKSTLTVKGDVNNSGSIYASLHEGSGHNTITIDGTLTNESGWTFQLNGPGDNATIGSLSNAPGATVAAENGSTLTITGDVTNSGTLAADNVVNFQDKSELNITGTLTNQASGQFFLNGDSDSATLGGLSNFGTVDLPGYKAMLQINGDANNSGTLEATAFFGGNTLNITGNLTNSGTFQVSGSGDMSTIDGSVNNSGNFYVYGVSVATVGNGLTNNSGGFVDVESGSTLNITGDVTNNGIMATDDKLYGGNNTLSITGNLTNNKFFGFRGSGDMGSITGNVTNNGVAAHFVVADGAMETIGGSLTNSGLVDVENGSTLTVTGDVTNNGTMADDDNLKGGNSTLKITGTLANKAGGTFVEFFGPGDKATIGSLTNSGLADVENGSTLTINGAADNSGQLVTNLTNLGGGNTITVTGTLTNEATGQFILNGPNDMATLGGLTNSGIYPGYIDVEGGSTLQINGNATNSGDLFVGFNGTADNTLNITGNLNNQAGGYFAILGSGTGNSLTIGGNVTNDGILEARGNGSNLSIGGNLSNSATGFVGVEQGSTLTISGAVDNSGIMETNANGSAAGTPSRSTAC